MAKRLNSDMSRRSFIQKSSLATSSILLGSLAAGR